MNWNIDLNRFCFYVFRQEFQESYASGNIKANIINLF